MAVSWINYNNGESLLDIRNKINTFNTSVTTLANTNETNIAANSASITQNTNDIATNAANISTNTSAIAANALAISNNTTNITTNTNNIATNTADISSLDSRVTEKEAINDLLLYAASTASSQQPTSLNTPIQVEYGVAQTNTHVSITAAGAITFLTAGKYKININAHYGRTGGAGTSYLFFRLLLDGVQTGSSLAAKVDNSDVLVPWSNPFVLEVTAGQVLTTELMRDSAGNNSGGLFALTPTAAGWNTASCINLQVYKG